MLERFKYTNNFNETLEFGKDCLFVNENDLRNFAWDITSKNNKISGFKKGIVSKTIPVILKCNSEAEGVTLRNRLFEVFEKDVLAQKHGKIYIGDYYLQCYVTGSKKTQYLINKNYMLVSLTVHTDFPVWVKSTTTVHTILNTSNGSDLDFPYGYPHDFKHDFSRSRVTNQDFVASNFVLKIHGQVQNPTLFINGHKYAVNTLVNTDEYLTIDSVNKTIMLTKVNGEQVNCFNSRDRNSYIFEKIPSGINTIIAPHDALYFDLTLLEERSEPKWT